MLKAKLQSTHPCGVRQNRLTSFVTISSLQSAPPAGRDPAMPIRIYPGSKLQSTHPARGATMRPSERLNISRLQSTHLIGCDIAGELPYGMQVASNRAPLRGATNLCLVLRLSETSSPHAPLRGATIGCEKRLLELRSFNPRTPIRWCNGNKPLWSGVSGDFNPRTLAGRDVLVAGLIAVCISLILPLPAGCDLMHPVLSAARDCFNPRTSAGCDYSRPKRLALPSGFNPRAPAGCDLPFC